MSETSIAWTDYTFNPWWGCVRVSPGCEHCYAEAFAHRLGLDVWGPTAGRRFFDDKHWNEPRRWARRRIKGDPRKRVFCASMADVFEANQILDSQRERLWSLIEETPGLTWQLLTKRPENARGMVPARWNRDGWPANVWFMFTAEDQERFDARWNHALSIDAVVKGVSYEPALGPIDFRAALKPVRGLDWVVVGGESGHGARPFDVTWARSAIEQCRVAGVAPFVKQAGRWVSGDSAGFLVDRWRWPDGRVWVLPVLGSLAEEYRDGKRPPGAEWFALCDAKGGEMHEWAPDLRVREFPA